MLKMLVGKNPKPFEIGNTAESKNPKKLFLRKGEL